MLVRLFLLFTLVPLVELALLLYLADRTSWQLALLLVIVTGVAGTWLVRSQGLRTWREIQRELAAGRMPADALLDGVLIVIAGVLLLTPGVLTDLVGISLLLPFCRTWYRQRLVRWFKARVRVTTTYGAAGKSDVIDSYVVRPDDKET